MRFGLAEIEQARTEEKVRRRAKRDRRAGPRHPGRHVAAKMDAVREDRAIREQPEPVIDVEIIARVGKSFGDRRDFRRIFGHVGMHQDVFMGCDQFAGEGELLIA